MSLESVRAFLAARAPDVAIVPLERNSETMSLSAAWGVKPAQIAKSLALRVGDGRGGHRDLLLLACGDSRLDNKKVKAAFGGKAKMLAPDEAAALTGHPVGGVCPFGLATDLPVYCDVSMRAFDLVYPAAGSLNSSVEVTPERLFDLVAKEWVDICKLPDSEARTPA
jgi:prolyl-tRNA editing enzyme YbaK/EbsC (Cys-tRNA(Pro) deacylase)